MGIEPNPSSFNFFKKKSDALTQTRRKCIVFRFFYWKEVTSGTDHPEQLGEDRM